jgi:hypothetical protein
MISDCGAQLIGCSVIVDQMTDLLRHEIGRVNAVLRADELPPS